MSADIRSYQNAEGLSDEQMAALLTDKLGRPISVAGYKTVKSRKGAPDEWLETLGIAPQEPTDADYAAATDSKPRDWDDDSPDMDASAPRERKTRESPVAMPLPFEPATAQMQLTLIYTMAGRGAAIALRSPEVAEVWANHAPQIAAAYIEWARYNPRVAHYIAAVTLGGPAGQLVLLHGSLLVTTLIVSGRVKPENFIPPVGQETDTIDEPPNEGATNGDDDTAAKPPRKRRARASDSAVRGVE